MDIEIKKDNQIKKETINETITPETILKTNEQNIDTQSNSQHGKMFGLISGSITTIGVMIGLWQSHNNIWIIISGILSIALSDSFSDGLGMYFSQRTEKSHSKSMQIGIKTTTYKMLVTLSYIIPFLVLDINNAIQINIMWGCLLIAYASYQIKENIFINLIVALMVILISYIGGNVIKILIKILSGKSEL
jgi:vacuolar iron transporter family protein